MFKLLPGFQDGNMISESVQRFRRGLSQRRTSRSMGCESLETRILPAITVAIDYSLDSNGFFDLQERRDELQRAADTLSSRMQDNLSAITPGGGNSWTAQVSHPGNDTTRNFSNLNVPADTLIFFAGGRALSGAIAEGGPGGFSVSGSPAWLNLVSSRGQAGALGAPGSQTDVGFWGGTIAFSTTEAWHAGPGSPTGAEHSLYSIALHELSHAFGVGASSPWFNQISGSNFTGSNSVAAHGGQVAMSGSGHWASGTTSTVPETGAAQIAVMVAATPVGAEKEMTFLDWAALADVGWEISLGNLDPTLDAITDMTLPEGAAEQTVALSGITAGGNEDQPLRVTATSSNFALIPDPDVDYTSPGTSGQLRFTPLSGAVGSSTISVTVEDGGDDGNLGTAGDNGTLTRTFVVEIDSTRPTILSPETSTTSQRPRIEWTSVPGAASWQVWIGNSSNGRNPWVTGESATTFFDVPTDLGIGKMDLWVRGVRADGTFLPWTNMHRFNVITPPVIDDIETRQETARPTITWPELPGADSYDLWVNNVSTGASQVIRESISTNAWTPPADLPMSRFRVWVRGEGPDGFVGNWSVRQDFYTAPAPEILGPTVPTFDRTPRFDWRNVYGADTYGVYVKSLVDGTIVANLSGLPSSDWTPSSNLPDGSYVWWAIAESSIADYRGAWTDRTEFYVGGQTSVIGPESPTASGPWIEWVPVLEAARYELWVNGDTEGPRIIHETGLTGTSYKVSSSLGSGQTYRVWVRAVSTAGETAIWSNVHVFTVAARENQAAPVDQFVGALTPELSVVLSEIPSTIPTADLSDHDRDSSDSSQSKTVTVPSTEACVDAVRSLAAQTPLPVELLLDLAEELLEGTRQEAVQA